jgi:hypothetical protein
MRGSFPAVIVILMLALLLGGCAAMQTQEAQSKEQLLSAAGFQMKIADTPQKQAHIQDLPQRNLMSVPYKGKVVYVYRDGNNLYMGDQGAYQRYQQLALAKQMAREQVEAAEMNASADWGVWGWGWGPYMPQ